MKIKTTKGEVIIKDSLTRGERRKIESGIFSQISAKVSPVGAELNLGEYMGANETALLSVIESIKIAEEPKPITMATLDNEDWFTDEDFASIEKLANQVLSGQKIKEEIKKKSQKPKA